MEKYIVAGKKGETDVYLLITENEEPLTESQVVIEELIIGSTKPLKGISVERVRGEQKTSNENGRKPEYKIKLLLKPSKGKDIVLCDQVLQELT